MVATEFGADLVVRRKAAVAPVVAAHDDRVVDHHEFGVGDLGGRGDLDVAAQLFQIVAGRFVKGGAAVARVVAVMPLPDLAEVSDIGSCRVSLSSL